MKIISSKFLMVFFLLFNMATVLAGPPPQPPLKGPPIKPPVAPIDENLLVLMVVAVSFGIYSIYKYKLKQKTPA
jgi:hypothetical protein